MTCQAFICVSPHFMLLRNIRSLFQLREGNRSKMKLIVPLFLTISLLALTFGYTSCYAQGAAAGNSVGGASGAVLNSRNPWRGGVIGGAVGAMVGATIADVSYRASREAAVANKPVEYTTENGRAVYRADPVRYDERTRCWSVRERIWEYGRLVKDEARNVCEVQPRR